MMTRFALLLALAACGGDDTGGLSGPPCEQLAQRMCDAARDCSDADPRCRWTYGRGSSLERNCAVCEGGLIDRFCNDTTKTAAMIEACSLSFGEATCEASPEGEPWVVVPAECDALIPCNDGPCTQ